VWANFDYWKLLFNKSREADTLRAKLKVFFGPPEWDPALGVVDIPAVDRDTYRKFETPNDRWLNAYVFLQLPAGILGVSLLLAWEQAGEPLFIAAVAGLLIWTLGNWGALFHARRYAEPSEWLRLVAALSMAWGYGVSVGEPTIGYAALAFSLVSAALFFVASRSAFGPGRPPAVV